MTLSQTADTVPVNKERAVFRKVLLAVFLGAVLIGVSYFQLARDKQRTGDAYQKGRQAGEQQLGDLNKKFDSAKYSFENQQVEAAKLIWQRELAYQQALDSLKAGAGPAGKPADVRHGKVEAEQSEASQMQDSATTRSVLAIHQKILKFYEQRYESLPRDLSPYEKTVALREIRDETARQFSITLAELDKIRHDNNLDY